MVDTAYSVFYHFTVFFIGKRGPFSRRTDHHNGVRMSGELAVNHLIQHAVVDAKVRVHRGDQRHSRALEDRFSHLC